MSKKLGVFIGRLQPFQNGHYNRLLDLVVSTNHVVVILGSAYEYPPNIRNPWQAHEREAMVRTCFDSFQNEAMTFLHQKDYLGDKDWVDEIHREVELIEQAGEFDKVVTVCSDHATEAKYKKWFPDWEINVEQRTSLSGTKVRSLYFESHQNKGWFELVPEAIKGYLSAWKMYRPMLYSQLVQQFKKELAK